MDIEFKKVKSKLDNVEINIAAAREHMDKIEQGIHMLKERCRYMLSGLWNLGWLYFHKWISVHCFYHMTKMINTFPMKQGISHMWSLRKTVTGQTLDMSVDLNAQFGAIVEASYNKDITNSMGDCTHLCIALGASGNMQGLIKCFDLHTGKVVLCCTFSERPMSGRLFNVWGK